jgi:hypothetical protein
MTKHPQKAAPALLVLAFFAFAPTSALACDEFASRLLATKLAPAIASLGCSALGKAGLDNAGHKLANVCYASDGPNSSIRIVADLNCRTSSAAFIKSSVSESVTVEATVRGSDCSLSNAEVMPSGEIGKVLSQALDLNGRLRSALQDGLNTLCGGR